jgi:hypothetical protein
MSRTADDHGIDVEPEAERAQAGDASAAAADVPLNEARELLLP